jgi:hypothetical protein
VFAPIGGGKTAVGELAQDGSFQLTTEGDGDGALPGTYRIRVIQSRDTDTGKLYTSHEAPSDKTLEVIAGEDHEFVINIRKQDGWQSLQGD